MPSSEKRLGLALVSIKAMFFEGLLDRIDMKVWEKLLLQV
jgi:hypothetical protein